MKRYIAAFLLACCVEGYAQEKKQAAFVPPFDFPLTLSGNFGEIRSNHFHGGLDFKTGGTIGKPVRALADGYISRIRVTNGSGYVLDVCYHNGYSTINRHLSAFLSPIAERVKKLQYENENWEVEIIPEPDEYPVKAGQRIALSGNTGYSFGPHLHLDVFETETGDYIDPMPFFKKNLKDTRAPKADGIMLFPQLGKGVVSGSQENKTILPNSEHPVEAWGVIGTGIKAYDYMDGVNNHYGVYSVVLTVDGTEVFRSTVDRFSQEENRMINSWTTINGLGERAGNAPLASVQAILKDHFNALTNIDESRLNDVSRVVESYSGIVIPANKPIVGENVFTQVAGVHADGDNKNNLYCNDLLPERFGRKREYALGKTSGKANIRKNLEDLGLDLDEESMRKVTERIIELGDKKELVTQEDLPYIVSDVLKHGVVSESVKLKSYIVTLAHGLKPMATVKIEINGKEFEENSSGDGQYDAFVRALRKIYKVTLGRKFPMLTNYAVSIPPGGRTDAFVQTVITWSFEEKVFRTRGLDADQTEAAIKATMKMLNIIENEYENNNG